MEEKFSEHSKNGCTCKHIEGIICDVKNCTHHIGESYCTANQIVVGPSSAETSAGTACATFKPRSNG